MCIRWSNHKQMKETHLFIVVQLWLDKQKHILIPGANRTEILPTEELPLNNIQMITIQTILFPKKVK